jgi:hypothetical protein
MDDKTGKIIKFVFSGNSPALHPRPLQGLSDLRGDPRIVDREARAFFKTR